MCTYFLVLGAGQDVKGFMDRAMHTLYTFCTSVHPKRRVLSDFDIIMPHGPHGVQYLSNQSSHFDHWHVCVET